MTAPAKAPGARRPRHGTPLGRAVGRLLDDKWTGAAGLAVALLAPFVIATPYALSVMTSAAIFVMLASGLNIVVGFCGLLDLGYVAFYAVGAYTSGVLATRLDLPLWATVPAVVAVTALAGVVIGAPTLRLRSDYLAIVTLGFGEIIRITANNLEITGGPSGIYGIPGLTGSPVVFYYITVAVVALAVVGASRLGRSRLGRAWRFVREDEDAAEAMGVHTYRVKLAAYVAGAVWGGLAGVLFAAQVSAISPGSFTFLSSALVLMAVVLGGMGSSPGVVIGAVVVSLLPEVLRDFADHRFLLFGVLLIVVMLLRPQGLWPHRSREAGP
ncbi:branched-chain amino acid ABC transporter permease [Sphaerisporangium krabiense]|uniref:Branched-chain amino acid transport system permease protein n=1 Tax=Sphaerisporangium krabiense TaxID=763782 RepID=A0A7W8ZBK9_9ACTN|nr:branched-chain amino acid ABC transporter permease [Sphaerisporangium krabiense]MBB5631009.1 branched-chain amino acid transport system permease protein [Sphaerisporangium krabiense]GII65891.1 branched-chain amino acid ABC transporter permease [Sphaerisporangium krabiense]